MRAIIAIAATTVALVGCGSSGSVTSSSAGSSTSSGTSEPCAPIVTKAGVVPVESC